MSSDLGPATEARLAQAFAARAIITAKAAALALGVDQKALRAMREAGSIRAVIVGASTWRYTEPDLRAYLAGDESRAVAAQEAKPCPSTNRRSRPTGTTTSSTKVIGFTEARARRLAAKRKQSNEPSARP